MSPVTAPRAEVPPPFPSPFPPPFPPPGPVPPIPQVNVRPPMVFVEAAWEYKHITREAAAQPLAEAELNELGTGGWELVAVLNDPSGTHYYFKRQLR